MNSYRCSCRFISFSFIFLIISLVTVGVHESGSSSCKPRNGSVPRSCTVTGGSSRNSYWTSGISSEKLTVSLC
uniref:Uncharacterized protein n=1 Tax=Panstrongylus lignarius TaxID=156445 RepID=A0A224Y5K8_9HEMI